MDTITPLLDLPFETLALLAAGYLSYRIAYTGKDGSHQSIDVVFLVVVFAFIAKTAVLSVRLWPLVPRSGEAAVGFGVLAAIVAACLWRMFGERQVFYLLRAIGVSASDRYLTAWESMIGAADTKPTQVIVRLKDGSRLMCETLAEFNAERSGAVIFG